MSSIEKAGYHEVTSIDLERIALEAQQLADKCHEVQRLLVLCTHAEGLRECFSKARVALEIAVICAKESARFERDGR